MNQGCKHPCAGLSAQLLSVLVNTLIHSPAPSALTELTSPFRAYNLEVSLLPPEQSLLDLPTLSLQHIPLLQNLTLLTSTHLLPSLQLVQLTCPCHSLNFAPGRHLRGKRAGKDREGCLQPGSRRWRQLMASTLSSHQPLLTEKTRTSIMTPSVSKG